MNLAEIFGEPISVYTRGQAIEDGVLVDAGPLAREAGITVPVALTRAAWERYVTVPSGVEGQDETGRLWDVLYMLRHYMKAARPGESRLFFELYVGNDNRAPRLVQLKAMIGPGDHGEPVLTVMLPHED